MKSDMADIEDQSEPTLSLKRPLKQDNLLHAQLIPLEDSVVTKVKTVERSGLADTNGSPFRESVAAEPESKRVKLDNSQVEVGADKVDARDKVKGVALVKEEYVNKFVHKDSCHSKSS